MKKAIYTLAILASVFTSCTGDIEDDISALEENLTALQAENDALQAELDGVSNNLDEGGVDVTSPTKINHEYTNDDTTTSETVTFLSTTAFYYELNNRSYTHLINIYSFSINNRDMSLEFYYNSDTEEVTLDRFNFDNNTEDYYINNSEIGSEHTIKVNSFDFETGEISFDFSMEYDSNFSDSDHDSGKLNFSFNDILERRQ